MTSSVATANTTQLDSQTTETTETIQSSVPQNQNTKVQNKIVNFIEQNSKYH